MRVQLRPTSVTSRQQRAAASRRPCLTRAQLVQAPEAEQLSNAGQLRKARLITGVMGWAPGVTRTPNGMPSARFARTTCAELPAFGCLFRP